MTGEEIKALLEALDLTPRKLAAKLGVDTPTVQAWTREELFPTKRHVDAMRALRLQSSQEQAEEKGDGGAGGGATTGDGARAGGGERAAPIFEALATPATWTLLRKLLAYPKLREEVERAAAKYRDPAGNDAEHRKT